MMDNLDFSEEEIQEQLAALGYRNIPQHRLCEFKQDLDDLVRRGEWKSFASPAQMDAAKPQAAAPQPSPPAFTKEKVGRSCFEGSAEGFFLRARTVDHDRPDHGRPDHDRLDHGRPDHNRLDHGRPDNNRLDHGRPVLTACQNRAYEQQQGCRDSYARHSVALNLRLPPGAPGRLQVEEDEEDDEEDEAEEAGPKEYLHPPLADSCASTPDSHRGRFTKRKVLRKHKGESLVCDESVYSEEASSLEEQLADLHLSARFETESDGESAATDGVSFSAFESYMRGMTRTQSDGDLRPKPKSFIRPAMSQRSVKKTDPVAKYFKYKQLWEMFQLPGEKDRRSLRWEIQERLAYRPPPAKPRRVFVPNSYVVPTDKKRSALRWEIRNDLANRLIPQKFSSQ